MVHKGGGFLRPRLLPQRSEPDSPDLPKLSSREVPGVADLLHLEGPHLWGQARTAGVVRGRGSPLLPGLEGAPRRLPSFRLKEKANRLGEGTALQSLREGKKNYYRYSSLDDRSVTMDLPLNDHSKLQQTCGHQNLKKKKKSCDHIWAEGNQLAFVAGCDFRRSHE